MVKVLPDIQQIKPNQSMNDNLGNDSLVYLNWQLAWQNNL